MFQKYPPQFREEDGLSKELFDYVNKQMQKIESEFSREDIAIMTGKSIRTVHNWFRYGTIDLRSLYKLNFELSKK